MEDDFGDPHNRDYSLLESRKWSTFFWEATMSIWNFECKHGSMLLFRESPLLPSTRREGKCHPISATLYAASIADVCFRVRRLGPRGFRIKGFKFARLGLTRGFGRAIIYRLCNDEDRCNA